MKNFEFALCRDAKYCVSIPFFDSLRSFIVWFFELCGATADYANLTDGLTNTLWTAVNHEQKEKQTSYGLSYIVG